LHFAWIGSKSNPVAMRMAVYGRVKKGLGRKKVRGKKRKRRYICLGLFTKRGKKREMRKLLGRKGAIIRGSWWVRSEGDVVSGRK
jgi:hypothetical protein